MPDPGVVLGFPYQQLNSESGRFGYTGMSPEEAIQQQRINRRQQIANLLIQRGLGQPSGQMAGRFYAPPSPVQGIANLAQLAAGMYSTHTLGEEERDAAERNKQATTEALAQYRGLDQVSAQPSQPAAKPPRQTQPAARDAVVNELIEGPDGRLHFPTDAPPLAVGVPKKIPGGAVPHESLSGGGERSMPEFQAASPGSASAIPASFQPSPGFGMPDQPSMAVSMPDPAVRRSKLAELMATSTPQAQQAIKFAEALRQHEADFAANREEKAFERTLRREGQMENAATRLAMMENTMAMKQMQLAQDERAGIRNDELKRDIQASQEEYKKLSLKLEDERVKAAAAATKERARESNELRRDLAEQNIQSRKELEGMRQADRKERQLEKEDQMFGEAAGRYSSSRATIENMAANIRALKQHPGLSRITGAMGALPNFPGSDAANAQAQLESLRSKTAAQAIADLRAMSKTGGAVGQVTEKEWPRLENLMAALDQKQDTPAFAKSLDDLNAHIEGMLGRLEDAFRRQFGARASEIIGSGTRQPSGGGAGPVRKYNPATGKIE